MPTTARLAVKPSSNSTTPVGVGVWVCGCGWRGGGGGVTPATRSCHHQVCCKCAASVLQGRGPVAWQRQAACQPGGRLQHGKAAAVCASRPASQPASRPAPAPTCRVVDPLHKGGAVLAKVGEHVGGAHDVHAVEVDRRLAARGVHRRLRALLKQVWGGASKRVMGWGGVAQARHSGHQRSEGLTGAGSGRRPLGLPAAGAICHGHSQQFGQESRRRLARNGTDRQQAAGAGSIGIEPPRRHPPTSISCPSPGW
jgi:hypothetical protein